MTHLEARADGNSLGAIAGRELERYAFGLTSARREMRGLFTPKELCFLADMANGTLWEPFSISLIGEEAADAMPELGPKWAVGSELLSKLRGLTYGQKAALVDAIERFWNSPDAGSPADPATWAKLGLTVEGGAE